MCGRFTLRHSPDQIAIRFGIREDEEQLFPEQPRYNIAPTQQVTIVRENGARHLESVRWGLVPSWAKDISMGSRLINARAETLAEKPAFKQPLLRRRCLVPADGFYEWMKEGQLRQPVYVRLRDDGLFAFAGLWEEWRPPDGPALRTCTIITVAPNELMAPIHNRMPAILRPEHEDLWLDSSHQDVPGLLSMLQPYSALELEAYAVSRQVNSPTVDSAVCIQRVGGQSLAS